MKKKALAAALAMACALSLAACGETGSNSTEVSVSASVKEETKTSAETPASTETSASVEASAESQEPGEGEYNINGIWQKDKFGDEWIEIRNLGQEWSLYNYMGEEAVKGTVELQGENFALIDGNGETVAEFNLTSPDTVMDLLYDESYTKVDSLPEKFPGQLAAEIGFGAIEGDWFYQQSSRDNTSDYTTAAYVSVLSDGTYTIYWLEDEREATGTVVIGEMEDPDGSKTVTYSFYEGGNNYWITAVTNTDDPESFLIDQEGLERLVINVGEGD